MRIGLVGLPNAGKSTLFNALVKKQLAKAENRPFTTIDPNIGIVDVPDQRLEKLAQAVKTNQIIPTTLKVVDIAGLITGAHQGAGLGNQFLSHIREVDLIVYVVRAFEDPAVAHVSGAIRPKEDLEILQLELQLADEGKIDHRLTDKPYLVVVNVSEDQLKNQSPLAHFHLSSVSEDVEVLPICAKTEAELVELSADEQKEYLKSLGLNKLGLDRLLQKAYQKLGLITFFTAGEKEVRAWTIRHGARAPEAAAKIHTDLQRGFIAANVIQWQKLVEAGGWKEAREKGWVRLEGKEHVVQDGDVLIVRFNV